VGAHPALVDCADLCVVMQNMVALLSAMAAHPLQWWRRRRGLGKVHLVQNYWAARKERNKQYIAQPYLLLGERGRSRIA